MILRLPHYLVALRHWPAGAPDIGELRETPEGAEAALRDESGLSWRARIPLGNEPVRWEGQGGFILFFRWADATTRPVPAAGNRSGDFSMTPGDALVCLSGGAARVADFSGEAFGSHRLAGHIHLHDEFNAPRLAEALLAELERHAGGRSPDGPVACLVIEAR